MKQKIALITGITGQDGSYLAELLLQKGYQVHGLKRRSSSLNTSRIDHIYQDPHDSNPRLFLHYADMTDTSALIALLHKVKPDEVYNLAAQSHVAVSFDTPEYTCDVVAQGALRLLEAIRQTGLPCRFFQASSSEMYGDTLAPLLDEQSPFAPCSPYAIAKLAAHWSTVTYRRAYGIYAVCGIMFNHESPRRGETFVTRKISRALAAIALGQQKCLFLGNLDARRDWGYAKDYMQAAWLMLQQAAPVDLVIATGEQYTVRQFLSTCAAVLGIELAFLHDAQGEYAQVVKTDQQRAPAVAVGDVIMRVDPRYYRPAEVNALRGDATRAKQLLGWQPQVSFAQLCALMVEADLRAAKRQAVLLEHGFAD